MSRYQPQGPFNVWFELLKKEITYVKGVNVTDYKPEFKSKCSCINYSSSNVVTNDLKNTSTEWSFESRYSPLFQAGDRIKLLDDNTIYEIKGEPENVRRENKYIKFKMVRVKNGK